MMIKIRVLQLFQSDLRSGGVETVIKGICSAMDKTKYTVDVLTCGIIRSESESLKSFFERNQVTTYELGIDSENNFSLHQRVLVKPFKIYRALTAILSNNKYDVAHIHCSTYIITASIILAAMKNCPEIVLHGHMSDVPSFKHTVLKAITWPLFNNRRFSYFACSEAAGKYVFGNRILNEGNYQTLRALIDIDRFTFDETQRALTRASLGKGDDFIVGIMGRICPQKNHFFALEVFRAAHEKIGRSCLVIVGEGDDESELKRRTSGYGLDDCVIFYGVSNAPYELYQAFDILLLPSNWEGLGLVAIEAQVSGLPVIASTNVPREIVCTSIVEFISLNQPVLYWADKIISYRGHSRFDTSEEVRRHGWDVKNLAEIIEDVYSRKDDTK